MPRMHTFDDKLTDGFRLVSLVDNNFVVFGGGADNDNDSNTVVVQEILYAGQRSCNSVVFFEIVDSSSNPQPPPPPPIPFDVESSPARRKNDSYRSDAQTCDADMRRGGTFDVSKRMVVCCRKILWLCAAAACEKSSMEVFGPISSCLDRFYNLFGPISFCSDRLFETKKKKDRDPKTIKEGAKAV